MLLSDAVPARRSEVGTILSPENLVQDAFIIILWLLVWDNNVLVFPFVAHRSVTADTMASPVRFTSIAVPINFISTYNQFCKSCFPLALPTCTFHLHFPLALCTCTLHLHFALALPTCTSHLHFPLALPTCTSHLHLALRPRYWLPLGSPS
jgi:hypothetical protein